MRCSCTQCGVYMIQSEGSRLGCVCPECGNRCTLCLGTDCVMDRESVRSMKNDPLLAARTLEMFREGEDDDDEW